MCGIFGALVREDKYIRQCRNFFDTLATMNVSRGNQGWGIYARGESEELLERRANPLSDRRDGQLLEDGEYMTMLGHVRASTASSTKNVNHCHPFDGGGFLLAHNGVFVNTDEQRFAHFNNYMPFDVDTQLLVAMIKYHREQVSNEMAIIHSIQELRGQQACWLFDRQTQKTYLWRVMSPLYVSDPRCGYLYFSSVSNRIMPNLLPEGVLFEYNQVNGLVPVRGFKYETHVTYSVGNEYDWLRNQGWGSLHERVTSQL